MKYRSINDIMLPTPSRISNVRLIGKTASNRGSKTFIVPCYFHPKTNRWLCIDNHHNGARKSLSVQWRSGLTKLYSELDEPYYITRTHGCLNKLIGMAESARLCGKAHKQHSINMDVLIELSEVAYNG